jgi:hypothetical protein
MQTEALAAHPGTVDSGPIATGIDPKSFFERRRSVETPSGRISYVAREAERRSPLHSR